MEQTEETDVLNEVVLRGRVSSEPQVRDLPSGTTLVSFRLVMGRDRTPMTVSSKQVSDWVECAAWGARVRKQAGGWRDGDQVEVRGALRRRYYRAGEQARTISAVVLRNCGRSMPIDAAGTRPNGDSTE